MTTTKKTTSDTTAKTAEAAFAASKEGVETALKASTEAVTQGYERAAAAAKEQVDTAFQVCDKTFKDVDGYKDFAGFGKQNFDAAFKSGAAAMKGFKDMSEIYTGIFQTSMESAMSAGKAMLTCRTFQELAELQSDFAKKEYDVILADGQKLAGLSMKVAEDALAPIQARMDAAVVTFSKMKAV